MSDWEDLPSSGGWEDVQAAAPADALAEKAKTERATSAGLNEYGEPDMSGQAVIADPNMGSTFKQDTRDTLHSIGQLVRRFGHDVVNPSDAASDVVAAGKGIASSVYNAGKKVLTDPAGAAEDVANYTREHPANTLLSLMLPVGTPGSAALKATTLGLKGVDEVAGIPAAVVSGVSRRSQRAAFKAGELGGEAGDAFLNPEGANVVDRTMTAADKLAADKNAARNADASVWANQGRMADMTGIRNELEAARADNRTGLGAVKNTQAEAALDRIGQVIDEHTRAPGGGRVGGLNLENADALKQAIGEVMFDKNMAPQGTPASALSGRVYNAAKDMISEVSPEYAGAMERNQANILNLKDLRKELSLNRNASSGTVLSKLQSAMRNDVSSKFGYRSKLVDQLAAKDPTIPYALAGQDFSTWLPRGLAKAGEGAIVGAHVLQHGAAGLLNPAALATMAASIPRVQGLARYGAGAAVRGARKIGATQQNMGRTLEALRMLSQLNLGTNNGPGQ